MTSRSEGFGLVIIEAFLSHLPVIATDVPGIRQVVVDGVTGLLTPDDDPTALARLTRNLWQDPARCEELRGRARKRALERYSSEQMAEAYLRYYEHTLG